MQLSRKAHMNRRFVLKFHTLRLDNTLLSNGVNRILLSADGNCFLEAVLKSINLREIDLNIEDLGKQLMNYVRVSDDDYKILNSCINNQYLL